MACGQSLPTSSDIITYVFSSWPVLYLDWYVKLPIISVLLFVFAAISYSFCFIQEVAMLFGTYMFIMKCSLCQYFLVWILLFLISDSQLLLLVSICLIYPCQSFIFRLFNHFSYLLKRWVSWIQHWLLLYEPTWKSLYLLSPFIDMTDMLGLNSCHVIVYNSYRHIFTIFLYVI